ELGADALDAVAAVAGDAMRRPLDTHQALDIQMQQVASSRVLVTVGWQLRLDMAAAVQLQSPQHTADRCLAKPLPGLYSQVIPESLLVSQLQLPGSRSNGQQPIETSHLDEKMRLLRVAEAKPEWETARLAMKLALCTTMRGMEIKNLHWGLLTYCVDLSLSVLA